MVVVSNSGSSGEARCVSIIRALGLLNWVPNLIICSFWEASVRLVHSRFVKGAF